MGLKPIIQLQGISEYRLANGLRVVLAPDSAKPTFTINMTVLVGSIHEGAGEAGMAHVFEHLLFHSLEGFPDVKETFNNLGAQCNGTTSFDRTNYFATISFSKENLETAIRLEAARLGRAVLSEDDLLKERKIVESEFELRANHPQSLMMRGLLGCMFDFHAYSREPIGTLEDFRSLKMGNAKEFYRRYYTPDNAVLFLAGKFDPELALNLVGKHFGAFEASKGGRPVYTTREPGAQGERSYVVRGAGDAVHIMAGYRIPGSASPSAAAADVLAACLSDGRMGLVYDALVGKGLASEASVFTFDLRMPNPWVAMATVPQGKDPALTEAALIESVEQGASKVTQNDLDRAKGVIERYRDYLMNSPEDLAEKLSQFEAGGSWMLLFVRCEQIKTLTLEAVREFGSRYIRKENRVLGRFEPQANAMVVLPDPEPSMDQYADLLSKIPATVKATKEFSYTPAALQEALTWVKVGPAKVGLISKEVKGDDVYTVIRFPFASRAAVCGSYDAGVALGALMTKRTKALGKERLEQVLAESTSSVSAMVMRESAIFAVKTKRDKLEKILPLAWEMLRTPFIQEQDLHDYIARKKGDLKALKDNPHLLLGLEINRMLFPEGDPRRTKTAEEQLLDLDRLTPASILEFHKEFFGASGVVGSVLGQLGSDDVASMFTPLLANGWKAVKPGALEINHAVDKLWIREVEISTPGKPSVYNVLVQPLRLSMQSADYIPVSAASWILFGDALGSRIPKKIREEEALSYAVQGQSNDDLGGDFSYYLILVVTSPENALKATEMTRGELDRALREGLSETEVEAFKKAHKNRLEVMRADDNLVGAMVAELGRYGLDFGLWAKQDKDLEALTVGQVNDALRRHFQPSKIGLIRIGDPK